MRYAVFTDIHANLEALEAVLAKIDELAKAKPIDQIWFLGDLVGYGPNPNECITKLRERTDVIIAGNHDWAAVGKIDLEDFSAAARISAEWTAEQLTEEHRTFLTNLPERLEIGECTLVHGSPFGPLWEYLTSEVLAERSFQYFSTRYCLVGHTHVPVIFIQPDTIANTPTLPLSNTEEHVMFSQANGSEHQLNGENASKEGADDETTEMVATYPPAQQSTLSVQSRAENAPSAYKDPNSGVAVSEAEANAIIEQKLEAYSMQPTGDQPEAQHIEEVPIDQAAEVVEPDSIDNAENTPPVQQQAAMLVSDVPETGTPVTRIDDVATEEDDESAANVPTPEKKSEEDETPAMVSSTEHEPAAVAEDAQISSIKTQETS